MNYVRRMLGGGAAAGAAAAGADEPVVEVVYDSGEEEEKPPQAQATSTRTMMEPEADGTPGTTSPPRHQHQPAVTNHPSQHAGVATQLTNKPGKAAAANMPNANWERGQTTNKHEETVTLSDGLTPSTSSQQDGSVFQKQMKKVRDWPMKQAETEKRQLVALRDRLKGGTSEQFKSVEAQRRAVENANEQIRATMKCIEEKRDQEQKNKPQAVETGDGGIQNYMKNNRSQTFLNQKLTPAMQEAGKRDENKRRNAAASGQSKTAQSLAARRQAAGGGNNNHKAGAGAPLMMATTFKTPLPTHGSAQYARARGALQSEEQGKQPFTAYNKPSGVKAKSTFDFSSQSDDDAFEEPPQTKKPPNKRRATAKDDQDTFNVGELDVNLGRGTRTTSTYPMARPQRNAAVVANARRSHQQQLELYRSDHRNSEYDMQRAMEESKKEAKKRNQQQRLHEESLHKNAAPEVVDLLDSDDGDDGRVSDAEFEEASKSVQESGRTRRGRANRRWASQRPVSEKLASLRAVYPLVPSSAPANDARGVGAAPAPAADVAPSAVAVIDADDDAAAEAKAAKAGAGAAAQVGGTAAAPPGDAAAAGATTTSRGGRVNVELSGADLAFLERGEFLNDTVIDWRVLRVKLEDLAEQPDVLRRCHFFNSFFYKKLNPYHGESKRRRYDESQRPKIMYDAVRRWVKDLNLMEKDFIFVPIHHLQHWSLAVICFPRHVMTNVDERPGTQTPCILHFDSMAGGHETDHVVDALRRFCFFEYEREFYTKSNLTLTEKNTHLNDAEKRFQANKRFPGERAVRNSYARQQNHYDCGLFVIEYIRQLTQSHLAVLDTKLTDIQQYFDTAWFDRRRPNLLRSEMYADLLAIVVQQNGGEHALEKYDHERTELQQIVKEAAEARNQDLQASMSRDVRKLDGKIAVLTEAIDLEKTWREKVGKLQEQHRKSRQKQAAAASAVAVDLTGAASLSPAAKKLRRSSSSAEDAQAMAGEVPTWKSEAGAYIAKATSGDDRLLLAQFILSQDEGAEKKNVMVKRTTRLTPRNRYGGAEDGDTGWITADIRHMGNGMIQVTATGSYAGQDNSFEDDWKSIAMREREGCDLADPTEMILDDEKPNNQTNDVVALDERPSDAPVFSVPQAAKSLSRRGASVKAGDAANQSPLDPYPAVGPDAATGAATAEAEDDPIEESDDPPWVQEHHQKTNQQNEGTSGGRSHGVDLTDLT